MGPNVSGRSIRVCSRLYEKPYAKGSVGQAARARYAKNVSVLTHRFPWLHPPPVSRDPHGRLHSCNIIPFLARYLVSITFPLYTATSVAMAASESRQHYLSISTETWGLTTWSRAQPVSPPEAPM